MNPFSVLFVSFIGGFVGSIFAMQIAQIDLNTKLIHTVTSQLDPFIDDIELQ